MSSLHNLPETKPEAAITEAPDTWAFNGADTRTRALVIIAFGVTIFLLRFMSALLAPLAFGLLLFYALDPAVDALERLRVPRWLSAATVLGITMASLIGGAYALQDEAMTVINELPAGARRISQLMDRRPRQEPGPLEKVEQAAEELAKTDSPKPPPGVVRVQVEEPRITATGLLWSGSMSAFGALNQLIMILFLTYFALLSDKLFRRKFVELAAHLDEEENHARNHRQHLVPDWTLSHGAGRDERDRRRGNLGRARDAWPRGGRAVGTAGRRLQLHSVLRSAHRQRRPGVRRIPPIRHARTWRWWWPASRSSSRRSKAGC